MKKIVRRKYDPKTIEVYKKKAPRNKDDADNIALIQLRKFYLRNADRYEYFKSFINGFNARAKKMETPKMANVIRMWLKEDIFEK